MHHIICNKECPICYEEVEKLAVCQNCKKSSCYKCIVDYNKANNTNKCLCPECKHKFNEISTRAIFANELNYVMEHKIDRYRKIVMKSPKYGIMVNLMNEVKANGFEDKLKSIEFCAMVRDYIAFISNKNYDYRTPSIYIDLSRNMIVRSLNHITGFSCLPSKFIRSIHDINENTKYKKPKDGIPDIDLKLNIMKEATKYVKLTYIYLVDDELWTAASDDDKKKIFKFYIRLLTVTYDEVIKTINKPTAVDESALIYIKHTIDVLTERYHGTVTMLNTMNMQMNFLQMMVTTDSYDSKLVSSTLDYLSRTTGYSCSKKFYDFINNYIFNDVSDESFEMLLDILTLYINNNERVSTLKLVYKYAWTKEDLSIINKEDIDKMIRCQKCEKGVVISLKDRLTCCKCGTNYCKTCCEILEPGHKCSKEFMKTLEAVKQDCKPCPKCSTYIYRFDGCSHMFCTNCHCNFDWNTGKEIEEKDQTNELYWKWKKTLETSEYVGDLLNVYDQRNSIARGIMHVITSDYDTVIKMIETSKLKILDDIPRFMSDDEYARNIFNEVSLNKCMCLYIRHTQGQLLQKLLDNCEEDEITELALNYYDMMENYKSGVEQDK